jgi:chaperonin GroES
MVVHVSASGLSPSKLKATGKRLLVIPDQEEAQTAGGILLMSSSASAGPGSSICGSVSSVGADCKTVKQGDSVLINGFAGSEIEFEDGSKGKFVTEDDVLAILG